MDRPDALRADRSQRGCHFIIAQPAALTVSRDPVRSYRPRIAPVKEHAGHVIERAADLAQGRPLLDRQQLAHAVAVGHIGDRTVFSDATSQAIVYAAVAHLL